ncbi:hypothetical protein KCU91_g4106, partial [Aureobasidium melanogenum]
MASQGGAPGAQSLQDAQNLINHIALPPQLPQSADLCISNINRNLLHLLQDAVKSLDYRVCTVWSSVSKMLSALEKTEQAETMRDDLLGTHLTALKTGDCFAVYLPLHNSAVLIMRRSLETVGVETFEISPPNESAMSTQGRLIRTFPARAIACPSNKFFEASFQSQLQLALRRLATESPPEYYHPTAIKSGTKVFEERDTTHPGFVNDYLMTILSVVGENYASITTEKRVREDILWQKTDQPWRRAPFWLFLRVAVLRTLSMALSPEKARQEYKLLIIKVVAQLLIISCDLSVDPNMLSVVHTKLARRVLKFEQVYGTFADPSTQKASEKACRVLQQLWTHHTGKQSAIKQLPVTGWVKETSFYLSLSVRQMLDRAIAPLTPSKQLSTFALEASQRTAGVPSKLPSLAAPSNLGSMLTALADVELWVEKHLRDWTASWSNCSATSVCDELAALIKDYWTLASSEYQGCPLEKSNALLIIAELWVSLDKICTQKAPLMLEYSPEIPVKTFECLLLPKLQQMQRLSAVELYVDYRHSRASRTTTSAFSNPTATSFSVRYYDKTPSLQQLRIEIMEDDVKRRSEKIQEFEEAMSRYTQLMIELEQLVEHDTFINRKGSQYHDWKRCRKCQKKASAESISIYRFEEALPRNEVELKAAIFELKIPGYFASWRDATWLIINDIGRRKTTHHSKSMYMELGDYDRLAKNATRKTRITLGSKTKPELRSHRKSLKLSVTIADICRPNGLKYEVWDSVGKQWLQGLDKTMDVKPHCTLQIPAGPYEKLQWAVTTTARTTNQVMSKQHDGDVRLEKEEFLAFGNLRAGERIQSVNILRELGCSNLDHTNPAVTVLLLQAVWESGSPSSFDHLREAHAAFLDPAFCLKLLTLLRRRLTAIENNWDKQYSMMTTVQLALRLLSLTADDEIQSACLLLLKDARQTTLKWCHQLETHIHQFSDDEGNQNEASGRLLLVALLCYSTFDVEERHIHDLLGCSDDLAIAAEAQAIVCDNLPGDHKSLSSLVQQSLIRHSKIAHRLEPYIRGLLPLHGDGLNSAVQHIWNGVVLGSSWTVFPGDFPSWVQNKTVPIQGGQSQIGLFNLLSGRMLVDGKPVGKVPDKIRSGSLFEQIFGSSVLRVFASDIPGMDSRVSQHIDGAEVHLGLRGHDIIIKARCRGRVLQALPQSTFKDSLPDYFVYSFHHWLDEESGDVEFCPLDHPWQSSENNWKMSFSSLNFSSARARLQLGSRSLINPSSIVGQRMAKTLSVLDSAINCHIMFDSCHPSELQVELRRYNLHFAVTMDGELRSLEFNAIVDPDQHIGTMIGLHNKLVLRSVVPPGCPVERKILIPFGEFSIRRNGHHVDVRVQDTEGSKRQHFVYFLDRHLRKLRSAQDTLALLYQAYLHAVTSFCLPDPLTNNTGVEEAIEILGGASLFTSSPLSKQEMMLLEGIAALTPHRQFYPQSIKVMQSVTWNASLPTYTQHDDFVVAAQAIVRHRQKCEKAHGQINTYLIERGDQSLIERARKRNLSVVKAIITTDDTCSASGDMIYRDRGSIENTDRATKVHGIASLVQDWPSRLAVHTNIVSLMSDWQVSGYSTSFEYDKATMRQLTTLDLPLNWGSLYNMCRSARKDSMLYPLMFTFCAIASETQPESMIHIRTLLAFAFSQVFCKIHPPLGHDGYRLANGSSLCTERITGLVKGLAKIPKFPPPGVDEQHDEYVKKTSVFNEQTEAYAHHIVKQWPKKVIVPPNAESIASLQRAERMLVLYKKQNYNSLRKELRTPGREGWSAGEHPSWLLLEIENNITIRPLQAKVAKEMMFPKSETNSVMQLNMGEGKSSVIVPMLAAALADGTHLVRVVVLKPLLRQTEQVLSQRLGGLLGHRVCHVPFSRKTVINSDTIGGISEIMADYCNSRGVVIVLPEEILSMKLMTREKIVSVRTLAASVLGLQRFLEAVCRDIIDESDEILGIKSQLIYPVGSQHMLDGRSDRWHIAQSVLRQIKTRAIDLSKQNPTNVQADLNGKAFPIIKIFQPQVLDDLLESLVTDIISGQLAGVSFDYFSETTRDAIRNFIRLRDVTEHDLSIIKRDCVDTGHWIAILIFRGYFAHDLLSFVLQRKRWLVEYGADLARCLMAVPYRAKGIPTQNSEFGHPDVAILLTCLSFYYTGLNMTQVEDCFKILLKDTNAQDIYKGWALAGNLPENLSSLDAINIDDRVFCREYVFSSLQFNLEAIDFYLNQVVFPREGKEFAKRLSASGWDIPSSSASPKLLTTGFSGTNDSRVILPHSVQQQDLGELLHTNAMVLDLILRKENRTYIHAASQKGKKLSVDELLSLMSKQNPVINVLIDVGAQVLEATNFQLAQRWLQYRTDAKAAVYFDDCDEAMVLDRYGAAISLRISPLSAIPLGAHAAVTLGPRLVKDRLAQDSFDVLAWCMEQTCQSLETARPLRAMQGLEYIRQQKVLHQFFPTKLSTSKLFGDENRIQRFWPEIQEDESRSLELLYGVHEERIGAFKRLLDPRSTNPTMQHLVSEYEAMNKTCLEDCTVDNEQERELTHEVEREQQVERPIAAKPHKTILSQGLDSYVELGTEDALNNSQVRPALMVFGNTSAWKVAEKQEISLATFADLYVSNDYYLTVNLPTGSCIDQYLNPVNWVLSSSEHGKLVVISQHEANELMPLIRRSTRIRLHTFAPRLNKAMVSFDDMSFYTIGRDLGNIPSSSIALRNLKLFSGSLYLESAAIYDSLRCFLGLVSQSRRVGDFVVNSDGFVDANTRAAFGWPGTCPFIKSPLPFLKEVYSLRRSGKGFAQTHMGHLFEGRALRQDAFDGCNEEREGLENGTEEDGRAPG